MTAPTMRSIPIVLLALLAARADACTVPVFRYALERWPADDYEAVVFHRGPLDEESRALIAAFEKRAEEASANLVVRTAGSRERGARPRARPRVEERGRSRGAKRRARSRAPASRAALSSRRRAFRRPLACEARSLERRHRHRFAAPAPGPRPSRRGRHCRVDLHRAATRRRTARPGRRSRPSSAVSSGRSSFPRSSRATSSWSE